MNGGITLKYISYNNHKYPGITTLNELIDYSAEKYKDLPFVKIKHKEEIEEKSFLQFQLDVNTVASKLRKIVGQGEKIAIFGALTYEWLVAYFGTTIAGNIIVPIDKDLNVADIVKLLKQTEIKYILFDISAKNVVKEIENTQLEIKQSICLQQNEAYQNISSWLEDKPMTFKSSVTDDDIATIVFTSGTTGYNKGVTLSHKNLCYNIQYAISILKDNLKEGFNSIPILPTHHMFLITAGLLAALWYGMSLCIGEGLKYINRSIQFFKPQVIFTVPMIVETMYKRVWVEAQNNNKEEELKQGIAYSKTLDKNATGMRRNMFKDVLQGFGGELEVLICGGAQLKSELVEDFEALGMQLLNGYGITECSPIVACNVIETNKPGTVGRIEDNPYCEVKIKDDEVMVRGGIVTPGYYNEPKATADVFEGEWFKTGDLGRIDEDGYLFITGRIKNTIILEDGNNISPEELEESLQQSAYIDDVVVYGKKLDKTSVVAASIYIAPDITADVEELKSKIKQHVENVNKGLPRYKQIQIVEFTETPFEKTALGKIKRYKIH